MILQPTRKQDDDSDKGEPVTPLREISSTAALSGINVGLSSALYKGTVRHRRLSPTTHEFTYRVVMLYLDLDEIDALFNLGPFWSRGAGLVSFRREDYLPGAADLRTAVADRVEAELGERPAGPIRMLSNPRYFGYMINPITVYYCFSAAGTQLEYMLLEVTNTPWKERISYVLRCDPARPNQRIQFAKALHVSPFFEMGMEYTLRNNLPGGKLALHLESVAMPVGDANLAQHDVAGGKVFDATLALERVEATTRNRMLVLLQHPVMTFKVFAGIHWQALRLWLKKVPIVPHPAKTQV